MSSTRTQYCVRATAFLGVLISVGFLAIRTPAQPNPQERAASLRTQLAEVEARQTELQSRLQQLEDELKPENIERSLAGVGSVHPEELRESRRRQLEIEKSGVQSQVEILAASRGRLETAIARADSESYWQSAAVSSADTKANTPRPATNRSRRKRTPK